MADHLAKYIDLYREHCGTTPTLNNQEAEVIRRLVEWARSNGPDDEAVWDRRRLDYLAAERAEEDKDIAKIGHVKMLSVFRRNLPITRDAIDDAMRFRESINRERDSCGATNCEGEKP